MIRPLVFAALVFTAAAAEADWRKVIHAIHRASIDQALAHIESTHAKLEPKARNKDAKMIAEISSLVTQKSLPFTDAELAGKWKCRSLQGGALGVFAYPFFACTIENKDGRLFLRKTSGSQFRRGYFYADAQNQRRIFLGVKYVTGDDPTDYSGTFPQDQVDGESLQWDSVGVLVKKAKNHFVLILDASPEEYEIYEFRR